jgi:hypothetical protein
MNDPVVPVEKKTASFPAQQYAWWLVLCLVGLDYFSTLAYLPSIAVEAAGPLAPLVAVVVVLVTLLGAVPVYLYVVGRSPHGQGATGLLESLVRGWFGKVMILVLLGFVATDFVVTRSLSTTDASLHIIHNPFWHDHASWLGEHREALRAAMPGVLAGRFFEFWDEHVVVTVLLLVIAFGFYAYLQKGFTRPFLYLAAGVVGVYLLLTGVVLASSLLHLSDQPHLFQHWLDQVRNRHGNAVPGHSLLSLLWALLPLALLTFPQTALGLSGFELSMTNAPLVRGSAGDDPHQPRGRIRNTRLMIAVAALIMGVLILGAILAVSVLVPGEALTAGAARHRALAYLAHGGALMNGQDARAVNPLFGPWFGTLYDLSTVLILCLAGASVTISLRDLVPHYLTRYGMQLEWARKVGMMLHLFNVVILLVVLVFRASVSAQQWAYATSVLVLLTGAAVAVVLDLRQRWRRSRWLPVLVTPFALIGTFFLGMAVLTAGINPSGLVIALGFVLTVLATGFLSRYLRSTELRFMGFTFADEYSRRRWDAIRQLEFQVLVPHRPGHNPLSEKNKTIRARHRLAADVPLIFIEVELGDPSDFMHAPLMRIATEGDLEVIRVSRCSSTAHVLAAIALEFREVGRPPELIFGWSIETPLAANLNFLFLGEGNIPWMVHELIRRAEPDPGRQPRVVIG